MYKKNIENKIRPKMFIDEMDDVIRCFENLFCRISQLKKKIKEKKMFSLNFTFRSRYLDVHNSFLKE